MHVLSPALLVFLLSVFKLDRIIRPGLILSLLISSERVATGETGQEKKTIGEQQHFSFFEGLFKLVVR